MTNNIKSDFFNLGPVTLSYVASLWEPERNDEGGERYSVKIIMNAEQKAYLEQWVDWVGRQAFPQEWDVPNAVKKPIHQCEEKPKAYMPRFAGHFYAKAKSQFAPSVVGTDKQKVSVNMADPNRSDGQKLFYGGCLAYVSVNVWSFRHRTGGPSVSLGIQAVMKVGDGEPIKEGGSVDVDALFADVPAVPVGAVAPTPGALPGQPAAQPAGAAPGAPPPMPTPAAPAAAAAPVAPAAPMPASPPAAPAAPAPAAGASMPAPPPPPF